MDVQFGDTTFRDGSQSLWAMGIRTGMIEAVAESMDRVGFQMIEVPMLGIFWKKIIRDLKEDPWELARLVAAKMPNTTKACMAGAYFHAFEAPPPRSIVELFYARLAEMGALNRGQITCNTTDQIKRSFPWIIPAFKRMGIKVCICLAYTLSPRHTDEYYAQKTREVLPFEPDAIFLKDQGGLLTVDRIRTLLPAIVKNASGLPVELHSHCTTGLAPLVYLEALQLGAQVLHTAIPPLANGSSQPSVFNVAANARLMGHATGLDEGILRSVSERLGAFAQQDRLPIGAPLEYDYAQYIHQVPGGVISNLKHNLKELGIAHRLDEVLEESVRVRKDMGYPIMITPHSQFVVTQSAINVAMGERYKVVTDELIQFALGIYGEDSGYPWMDQNLKDKLLASPRAKELKELAARQTREITAREVREQLGGAGVSDEEFLLRYIMKGSAEIEAMRAAGPHRQYFTSTLPLLTLLEELGKQRRVRYVRVERGDESLVVQNASVN